MRSVNAHLAACIMLMLPGCANMTSIYRNRPLVGGQIVTVDAKQRSVFVTEGTSHDGERDIRLCAEAAPDVFSALSASASLGADIKSQSGKAAVALAESAATIERTQTINLLRESMYRTCERYLSGALTRASFVIQAARDQRTMASILAIEQLTRTIRLPLTILAASGTSASVASDDAVSVIKQFGDEKAAAAKSVADAQNALADASSPKKGGLDCATTAQPTDDQLKLWTACAAAKQALDDRKKDLAAATERLDKVLGAVSNGGATTAATMPGAGSGGGGSGPASASDIARVADAVEKIAATTTLDEPLMFCIGLFSEPKQNWPDKDAKINDVCSNILVDRAFQDKQIRAQQLDLQEIFARPPASTDTATPTLRSYLYDQTVTRAERKRRQTLAADTAVALKLIVDRIDFVSKLNESDPAFATGLLARLRQIEADPSARAKLGN